MLDGVGRLADREHHGARAELRGLRLERAARPPPTMKTAPRAAALRGGAPPEAPEPRPTATRCVTPPPTTLSPNLITPPKKLLATPRAARPRTPGPAECVSRTGEVMEHCEIFTGLRRPRAAPGPVLLKDCRQTIIRSRLHEHDRPRAHLHLPNSATSASTRWQRRERREPDAARELLCTGGRGQRARRRRGPRGAWGGARPQAAEARAPSLARTDGRLSRRARRAHAGARAHSCPVPPPSRTHARARGRPSAISRWSLAWWR